MLNKNSEFPLEVKEALEWISKYATPYIRSEVMGKRLANYILENLKKPLTNSNT